MRIHSFLTIGLVFILSVTSCTFTQKIKDGDTAYERKQYSVAIPLLKKEYKKLNSRVAQGKKAFLIAQSLDELGQFEASIDWYQIAYDNQFGIEALEGKANALRKNGDYKLAIEAFEELGYEIGSPYEFRKQLRACKLAMDWKKTLDKSVEIRPADINTPFAEYAPAPFTKDKIVFTSDKKIDPKSDTYNWTGNGFSNIMISTNENGSELFSSAINTASNEGTITFTPDKKTAYFTRCKSNNGADGYCKIYVTHKTSGNWSEPEPLSFQEENINYGQATISEDGKTLYFVANHPDGWGKDDIWYITKKSLEWSEPKLLSRSINTIGNENFPVIIKDTIYFSSDFHPGMGGLDLFKSYKMPNGNWSSPHNLKPPFNSAADDFAICFIDNMSKKGYFSSNRKGGEGNDDIYFFEKVKVAPTEEPVVDIEYNMLLEGYVLEKILKDPTNPNSKTLGRKPLENAEVTIKSTALDTTFNVSEDGFFKIELAENTNYTFFAKKEGYLSSQARFSTIGIGKDPSSPTQTFEIEIILDKIFQNKEIVLDNIYYDFDRWDIRNDAEPTLNALANTLKLNPSIRIELGSHTDCRGNNSYNLNLSQKRAQAAVDYLIAKGIDGLRLSAKGYGESNPEADCNCNQCTEEEHQINRRTTFRIIE